MRTLAWAGVVIGTAGLVLGILLVRAIRGRPLNAQEEFEQEEEYWR